MLKKYVIIDYVENDYYYYSNDIKLGFALDRILDKYLKYDLPVKVYSYNNQKVYILKMEGKGE